jgi:hypothetical protein
MRLFKDLNESEKLLPNKRLFKFHGTLMIVYLILLALSVAITIPANRIHRGLGNILNGISNLINDLYSLVEMLTFLLVLKIMLPISQSDKHKRS